MYIRCQNLKANGYEMVKNWLSAGLGMPGHMAKSGKM